MNPLFFFILFALGFVFGLLLKKPTAGKFLIFGFVGVFVYEPVRDAGLLASAAFVAGIVSHHITLYSIYDQLPSMSAWRRWRIERSQKFGDRRQPNGDANANSGKFRDGRSYSDQQRETESGRTSWGQSFDESSIHHQRGYTSRDEKKRKPPRATNDRNEQTSEARDSAENERAKIDREKKRLEREKAELEAESQKFLREQRERQAPLDTRSDEEILGVSGEYTLADLKKARNAEVKRWNTSNMVNKPAHLVAEAEEEAKKINLAYERLRKRM